MNTLLFTGILEVAKKLIPDSDKRAELETKIESARIEMDRMLLSTTTTPKTDAFVKILYAVERFVSTLWRPIGSAAMTAFGMYAHWKGIDLGGAVNHAVFDGAFAAWGASRHMEKQKKASRKDDPLPDIELKDRTKLYGSK